MESRAYLKRLRIAPRKVRLVTGLLSGLDVVVAKNQLRHLVKRSARPIEKLIDSAAANAFDRNGTAKENLYIKTVMVDEGQTLKRYKPKGFGSSSPIAKKTSHITIVLDEKIPGLKASTEQKQDAKSKKEEPEIHSAPTDVDSTARQEVKDVEPDDLVKDDAKPTAQKELGKKESGPKGLRRFFRRKSI